ncbi:uncharacterized protein LOC123426131 [Hordeum vulgare subsp. vulgare]|uniref:uncharacterized protein LOC123426131 n=1 Tax=Hordeum vulgare subsp. vulgare TaxID=112509 RepID=UPI001D1A3866|nr:uncharacterized protein LOC123426131 [Hordeum vulgare subsp. vulgare]
MYQSMTNIMECDRTDLDNKFNTPEAGEYIHSEQNESPTNQAGAENPWNISLFDSMELDKVNDEQNYQQPSTFAREEQQFPSEESEGTAASEKQKGTHNSRQGQEEEFLNEVDIHNFLGNEEASAKEGNLRNVDSVTKPAVGMRFKSKQEGQEFFNFYSHVAGFCVTTVAVKRTSSKKRNNEITQITMKCNKHGKTKEVEAESVVPIRKSIVIAKTNCKVVLVLSKKEGTWERKLVYVSSNASKKKRKYEYFLGEIERIQNRLKEMDEESESEMNVQSGSTRTGTTVATNIDAEETTSRMNIQDPDVSATKGRPRMLSIREDIKQNKFYKCSHCYSDRTEDTEEEDDWRRESN